MNFEESLRIARQFVLVAHQSPENAANNPVIPEEFREKIQRKLESEETVELSPAKVVAEGDFEEWLEREDRGDWYYWPRLREHLISSHRWQIDRMRSLDDSTDEVLRRLSHPGSERFEKMGLVLGYVQSGKTSSYTGLIAKAADVGYKFFIVLSGMDKGLRLQTQIRLQDGLTGYSDGRGRAAVEYPEEEAKRWSTFTADEVDGDFDPGRLPVGAARPPILMVVKKNGPVLRRLLSWLQSAPRNVRAFPLMMIDDEADQASIDTTGGFMTGDSEESDPSTINRLIRQLLNCFERRSYVAYTATPFANILIPADAEHPDSAIGCDLYPKDFIIDLPKSRDYVGAEDLFGQSAFTGEEIEDEDGMDVIRFIPESETKLLETENPRVLCDALIDFILAGAARIKRHGESPATMLVHVSRLVHDQRRVAEIVKRDFKCIRDKWRYQRNEIKEKFDKHWDDFLRVTELNEKTPLIEFDELSEKFIGPFLESIQIREINSESGDILDYGSEPPFLKTIVIGGDKLSRGLTLEGLLVSYFSRPASTRMYDTLMQMGRWFGYRRGYEDLTRIYTTPEIASQFAHLARVERQLREDLTVYANKSVKPEKVGMRILSHPAMLVTNRLKQRYSTKFGVSYSEQLFQTYRFPLDDLSEIASSSDNNLRLVKELLDENGARDYEQSYPFWQGIGTDKVLAFLYNFQNREHKKDIIDIFRYIKSRNKHGELTKWNVAVMMSLRRNDILGTADWGIEVNQISRSRLCQKVNDLKSITSPGDEFRFLSPSEQKDADNLYKEQEIPKPLASRRVRSHEQGLIMLYPISKHSVPKSNNRGDLFEDPTDPSARDLIGFAISFPESKVARTEQYIQGRPGWQDNGRT